MRSAGLFFGLLAAGVVMVVVYIRSGESLAVLILSIVSLFAVVAIVQWRPWDLDAIRHAAAGPGRSVTTGRRRGRQGAAGAGHGSARAPVWRSGFDVTWDARGISGVAVGAKAPRLWSWSQIDDISHGWHRNAVAGRAAEERVALRLDFPSLRNPEEPAEAWVTLGPGQDPADVVPLARAAWRETKVTQSRFYDLSPEERTWQLADQLGRHTIDLRPVDSSPESLYREIRSELLSAGELCQLRPDASLAEVLDGFDGLLEVNGAEPISRSEADELEEAGGDPAAGDDLVAWLHGTLDGIAEQRGYRVAFIDQGGDDYLVGLVPADWADDWDGQWVGSGNARIVLDVPSTG